MDLRERIAADMPNTIAALERLVRIPSRGYPGYDPTDVRASAEATRDVLIEVGVDGARLLELPGGHPAVYGEVPGPSGAPTILLYAHHDVQPEGPLDQWDTPPFEPAVRDGRLYGRGAADDKSGIVTHAAAIGALLAEGPMPCTVKVLVEGEEECTTEHLPDLVRGNADLLRADVAVIADGGNQRTGLPAIDISLRGVTDCVVQVRVLDQAQHSGTYGGAIPDAITALARILASLHDDDGNVAIEGLRRFTWPGHQLDEAELLREVGARPGVRTIAAGTVSDRVWGGPAVSVLGIDAPAIHGSSNQLVPVASARVSLRLAPGDDAAEGRRRLIDHLKAHAPWGVEVTISDDAGGFEAGQGHLIATDSPAFRAARAALAQAYGVEPLEVGSGGSIPLVPMLVEALPGIEVLIVGAMDERSNIHSVNESVDLGDLERSALAEALFIRTLGAEG